MGRQSKPAAVVRSLGERIDAAATARGVTTTTIANAAGVTWAAADRWRKGKAWPGVEHARTIARVLGMTLDELLGPDEYEPPYTAWKEFLDTPTGRALTPAERRWFATQWFPAGKEPTLATYMLLAEARRTMADAS